MPVPRWPFDPRLPLEPRRFREISVIALIFFLLPTLYLGSFTYRSPHDVQLSQWDPIIIKVQMVSEYMVVLLSTYWTSNVGDIHYILDTHYELCHLPAKHPNCSQRLSDYWNRVQKSWVGRYLGTILWSIRILVYLYCSSTSPPGQGYCNFRHTVQLGCILFNPRRWSLYVLLILKSLLRYNPYFDLDDNELSRRDILTRMSHGFSEILLRKVLEIIRARVAVNHLPCAICDDDWPDVWTAAILPDEARLAKYQDQHCAHCWVDWAIGDIVTVFRCGHIFHQQCKNQIFQMGGRQVCPFCQFRVRYTEGIKRPLRRLLTDEQVARYDRRLIDDRFLLWRLLDFYLLDIRLGGREPPVLYKTVQRNPRSPETFSVPVDIRDEFIAPQNHMWQPERWPCKGRAPGY